jgi:ABC-type transport system substrate-binding protein
MVLERNEDFWGKKPKLDEFHMFPIPEEGTRTMAFESGDIDVIHTPAAHRIADYRKKPDINVIIEPDFRIFYLGFNVKDKLMSNKDLRKAIAHAINKDEIVDYVMEGLGIKADTVLAPALIKSDKKYFFDYDPAKSKELLAKAGYPNGVEINLWTPEGRYYKDRQIAEAIQGQLAKVGIKAKLSVMEFASWIEETNKHNHQTTVAAFGFSTADPDASLKLMFYTGATYNSFDYSDPKMDNLLDEAAAMMDPEERRKIYGEVQQLVIDDVIEVPIYHTVAVFAAHKNVKNFRAYPTNMLDIYDTTVE